MPEYLLWKRYLRAYIIEIIENRYRDFRIQREYDKKFGLVIRK